MAKLNRISNRVWSIVMTIVCVLWMYPIFMVLMNSLKSPNAISTSTAFQLPLGDDFAGFVNYDNAINTQGFFSSLFYSVVITVTSVFAILIFCSMFAWYITRVNTRITKLLYGLCAFSMVVPFQMVMFTMSKLANILHLDNPVGIIFVYLGFGAGLSTFTFTGFARYVPMEIEEAACIDGCGPVRMFFSVVFPVLKPTAITVAILNAMWIWNDYLLPYLLLGSRYKTIPIAVQYLKGGYGSVDMGAMMAMLVLAILPIVVFYLACQKHIIKGVIAGAVKG